MSILTLVLLAPFLSVDMNAAARDLGRNVAAAVAHEPVALSVKNLSGLSPAEAAEIRRAFESELKTVPPPATEVQLTISENLTQFLLVAEIRRGADRQVLIESWPRPAAQAKTRGIVLEKKLLWEQDQPILDAVQTGDALLVLDAARVLLVRGDAHQSAPLTTARTWPRDLRGRLVVSPAQSTLAFTAFLPGTICQGSANPQLTVECHDSPEPWLLAPGAIAAFDADRNFFHGHIDIEPGGARDLPPFYSAAPAGDAWIFAAADGRAHIYSHTWEVAGTADQWGSDIAAMQTPCGPRTLATRATANGESDAVTPYAISGAGANPDGAALEFAGAITALWSAGSNATAVTRDSQTGHYAAFSLVPNCGS